MRHPTFDSLPLDAKQRVDASCRRFEEAWKTGRPDLAAFLTEVPPVEQEAAFVELLHIDVERRQQAGEPIRAEDYLTRFPDRAAVIRTTLGPIAETNPGGRAEATRPTAPAGPSGAFSVPGYEMMEELGKGGMGVVYLARHVALNRFVALKFIRAGQRAGERHRERFKVEAEVIARLRHPNIVQIFQIGEAGGQVFLELEYADAGSLRQRLTGIPMAPRAAVGLIEPLVRAVMHAHRQGIIHRDIKPANVLLTAGGDSIALGNMPLPEYRPASGQMMRPDEPYPLSACLPKLTDFGLAMFRFEDSGNEFGIAAGTPAYMAPEQAEGLADCTPAVDIWGLGATLYEMLTGQPPFRAATSAETLRLVREVNPVPPRQRSPAVPRDLEAIVLRCLQKDPARRYPGARELALDLHKFLSGQPIETRSPGVWEGLSGWVSKNRVLAAVMGLVLAGAVAFGLWYAFGRPKGPTQPPPSRTTPMDDDD